MLQDLRYAFRTLLKNPGFTIVAVLTLALGIGANTAMFAVVHAVLLKPLPFADAERLMLVHLLAPNREAERGGLREMNWSYPKYQTFLELQQSFESTALFGGRGFSISGDDRPERIRGEVTTDRYPEVLGIGPVLGRSFTAGEAHRAGASPVAIIGHALWMRRYAGDATALGRTIQIDRTSYIIVGVMPPGFRGLSGDSDVWVPLAVLEPRSLAPDYRYSHSYYLVARRKATVTEEAAVAAVRLHGTQIDTAVPRPSFLGPDPWGATAASLYDSRADADIRRASLVLLGAVGFVLLIACVNLTNLLIAKAIGRRREVAVRLAIGASRFRVARQFIVESLLLGGLGAAAGLLLALVLLDGAAMLLPAGEVFFRSPIAPGVPRITGASGLTRIGASMIGLDAITLLFACGVAALAATLIAFVPATQASSLRPVEAMKAGGGSGTARGFHAFGLRAVLVTMQIAFALVLLAGAGLMIRSAAHLRGTGVGIDPNGVLTVTLALPRASYSPENGAAFFSQLLDRVRAVPGVESAGFGDCPPVSGGCSSTGIRFPRDASRRSAGLPPLVGMYWATPDYFTTLGIQLLRGRNFTERDRVGQPKVALVSGAAARAFWPNDTPIGKTIAVGMGGFGDGAEVIGVVSDVRYRTIETAPRPDVYIPVSQSFASTLRLFVRSRLDTESLASAIRREVGALDPNLPLSEVKTMDERIGDAMWRTRVAAWLFAAFAGLAVLLTAVGIFGVMAQAVAQRTPEIGVRMALGAQKHDVLRLVLSRAAMLAVAGIAVGAVLALWLTGLMTTLLYQVEPNDPYTLAIVAAVLGIVAMTACYLPVRRATRVNPIVALRYE
jgi:putative ABC transport system permease protein